MPREESLRFIRALAEEYGAARVFLFGSCLSLPQEDAHDIDLAVEGIPEEQLDAFWDGLMWADALGRKPVDVLRLEDGHWLNPIILDEGVLIYEKIRHNAPEAVKAYRIFEKNVLKNTLKFRSCAMHTRITVFRSSPPCHCPVFPSAAFCS